MACGVRGSGGGGNGGADKSSQYVDGYAAKRNVPHSGIQPPHAQTGRRASENETVT